MEKNDKKLTRMDKILAENRAFSEFMDSKGYDCIIDFHGWKSEIENDIADLEAKLAKRKLQLGHVNRFISSAQKQMAMKRKKESLKNPVTEREI